MHSGLHRKNPTIVFEAASDHNLIGPNEGLPIACLFAVDRVDVSFSEVLIGVDYLIFQDARAQRRHS